MATDRTTDANKPQIPHQKPVEEEGPLEVTQHPGTNPVKRLFNVLGPGLITGASDDDPSGIGIYSVAGASLGLVKLFWTSVINGLLAPPVLVVLMMISNNHKVMGKRVNSRLLNVLGWLATGIMAVAAIAMIVTSLGK